MLSKSLIQFSIDGLGCVPSLLFDLSPNYGGGKEDNRRLFKRCGALLHSVPATLQQATASPRLCWRLLDTHGEVGQSLVGSLPLSPGSWCTQSFVCVLQESVSPFLCKFWWLYSGVNGDLLQEAYAIPRHIIASNIKFKQIHCFLMTVNNPKCA